MNQAKKTVADYAVIAVAPLLVFLMLSALANFLMLVIYHGGQPTKVSWTILCFTLGTVSVARMSIEKNRVYSLGYAVVLGVVTFLAMQRFVSSLIASALLLVLIAYLSDWVIRDCTLIDEDADSSDQGLLASGQLSSLWKRRGKTNKAGGQPGRSVLYLALAALPLYGIGQLFIRGDQATWARAQWLLVCYLFAAIALLVTTSFLGLRRYLRQRGAEMPKQVSLAWLIGGIGLTAFILAIAAIAPIPGQSLASFELPAFLDSPGDTLASRFGWGKDGADKAQDGASQTGQDDRSKDKEIGSEATGDNGKKGAAESGDQKGAPSGKQSGGEEADKQSNSPSQQSSKSSKQQESKSQNSKDPNASSGKKEQQGQKKPAQQQPKQDAEKSDSQDMQKSDSEPPVPSDSKTEPSNSDHEGQPDDAPSKESSSGEESKPSEDSQGTDSQQTSETPDAGPHDKGEDSGSDQSMAEESESSDPESQENSSSNESPDEESSGNESPENESPDEKSRDEESPDEESPDEESPDEESKAEPSNPTEPSEQESKASNEATAPDRKPSPPQAPDPPGPSFMPSGTLILRALILLVLIGTIGVFLWRNRSWLASLFGREPEESMQFDGDGVVEPRVPAKPFSAYRHPGERAHSDEVIITTFNALTAWSREAGLPRANRETPNEFLIRFMQRFPSLQHPASEMVGAYNRIVYGNGSATSVERAAADQLWQQLRSSPSL